MQHSFEKKCIKTTNNKGKYMGKKAFISLVFNIFGKRGKKFV